MSRKGEKSEPIEKHYRRKNANECYYSNVEIFLNFSFNIMSLAYEGQCTPYYQLYLISCQEISNCKINVPQKG